MKTVTAYLKRIYQGKDQLNKVRAVEPADIRDARVMIAEPGLRGRVVLRVETDLHTITIETNQMCVSLSD